MNTTTTKITRQQAAALLLVTATGTSRYGLEVCALRVFDDKPARWEATNGYAMLLLLPWGVGDDEPHGLEPGVYLVSRRDLLRRAKMPTALWDEDVDGNVPLTRDDKRTWPNTPAVIPGEGGKDFGDPAAVHGMFGELLELPAKVGRAMFGARWSKRIAWRIERGESLTVQHFRGLYDGTTIDLYLMPARID